MDEEKRIGAIYVYQDSENDTPYIKGRDKDDIPYVTELSGKHEYLKKYIEKITFNIQVQRPTTYYSIFNEDKTLFARFVSLLLACGLAGACLLLFYSLQQVSLVWHASLIEKKIGAMLGYSMCFSLILLGLLIAGVLVLAFLNYTFNRKKKM